MKTTRRDTLKAIAAAGVMHHHSETPADPTPYRPEFFTAGEYACVAAVAARIIPSDGTPGATEAGVAAYIDETVKRTDRLQPLYKDGIAALRKKIFVTLPAARKDAILRKLDADKDPFWKSIRRLTIDGFYTSKIGLKELGYTGKSFLTEFKGCTHPEHQA
jgi:gluconate 2-dehydrogenase gamma chain